MAPRVFRHAARTAGRYALPGELRFREAMQLMRRHDPQAQEDGFATLHPHTHEHLPELIVEFEDEQVPGLRCWLLELIGHARDERALPLLAEQLNNPDEALRSRAITGWQQLGTRQARRLSSEHEPTAPPTDHSRTLPNELVTAVFERRHD